MKQLAFIIAASFLFSCNESTDTVDKSLEVKTTEAEAKQNSVSTDINADANVNTVDLNSTTPDLNTSATTTNTNNTNQKISFPDVNVANPSLKSAVTSNPSSAKGLNPAHGQPNHRCDIAVGDPLSTPIKQAPIQNIAPAAPNVNTQQVIPTPTPVAPKVSGTSTGRINPAHGEPGHDCAIQVGAPLP